MNADTPRIAAAAGAMAFLVGVPAFVYVSLTSRYFVVGECHFTSRRPTDPDYSRSRGCVGFRHFHDFHHGYRTQCVGIPVGPWRCRATLGDEQGSWEVPCR